MKTYKDYLKEHGWKQGLRNDPFSKLYTADRVQEDDDENNSSSKKNK